MQSQATKPATESDTSIEFMCNMLSTDNPFFVIYINFIFSQGAAVSSVVYLRNIFPEKAFCDSDIAGVKVRLLEKNSDIAEAKNLFCHVEEGLIKALEMNVLSGVDLIISQSTNGPTLEQYSFQFSDRGELEVEMDNQSTNRPQQSKPTRNMSAKEQQKKSVQIMLRKLLVTTDALGPLTDECTFSIRLRFKDHVPQEYQPKWFQPGGDEIQFQQDGTEPMDWSLGTIEKGNKAFELLFLARPEQIAMEEEEEDEDDEDEEEQQPLRQSEEQRQRKKMKK